MNELASVPFTEVVTPALVFSDDRHTDWAGAAALAETRPDIGWIMGNFAQFGAHNRNGNLFVAKDRAKAAARVKNTPMNMLHQRRNVMGSFVGSQLIDPKHASDRALPPDQMPHPYIEALGGFWRYHFRDEWKATQDAFDRGAAFLSMECVAETVTCKTPGCGCGGTTYPYRGVTDDTYCDTLNRPRSLKALNEPWFVGGALVIPPGKPGWDRADITRMAAMVEDFDQAETLYHQIADAAPHLDPREWELVMAMLVCAATVEDIPNTTDVDYARVFSELVSGIDFDAIRREHNDATAAADDETGDLVAAGLAIVAQDTGRVLMLQRSLDEGDPAGGTWEFAGGTLEDGEDPCCAACREWCEELGCELPENLTITGTWTTANGVYQGFVGNVPTEAEIDCNMDHENRSVLNPDDPDGDDIEVAAWWDPAQLPMPGLRPELAASVAQWLPLVKAAPASNGITKDSVNYRAADYEVEDPQMCGNCCYFDPIANTCKLVVGDIKAEDVCDLWTEIPDGAEVEPISSGVSRD